MPRFLKGTTDHDGDGHMGGSRREDMTEKTNAKPAVADKSSGEFVDGASVPNPKGTPSDAEDATVFLQGRTAALGSISKEDAPYDKSDAKLKVWLKGFESVER